MVLMVSKVTICILHNFSGIHYKTQPRATQNMNGLRSDENVHSQVCIVAVNNSSHRSGIVGHIQHTTSVICQMGIFPQNEVHCGFIFV